MRPRHQRLRAVLRGVVQGVGLRPCEYRLATELALMGWVNNGTHGVCRAVEGPAPELRDFVGRLQVDKPPHACIDSMATAWLPPAGHSGFTIRPSDVHGPRSAPVPAALAPCANGLADICNEADRRGHYPFTNCTHCGPRFTTGGMSSLSTR